MDGISNQENRKIAKVLFLCLLVYALLNHGVRALARDHSGARTNSLSQFSMATPTMNALMGFDDFRMASGNNVSRIATYCPHSITENCQDALTIMRIILGLH